MTLAPDYPETKLMLESSPPLEGPLDGLMLTAPQAFNGYLELSQYSTAKSALPNGMAAGWRITCPVITLHVRQWLDQELTDFHSSDE
jgi:hypothetical protein